MFLTGFADEAADGVEGQIRATKLLGWKYIECRGFNGKQLYDLKPPEYKAVADALDKAEIRVNCLGSAIANWSKQITDTFETSVDETKRAIAACKPLGISRVRIMSYAVRYSENKRALDDQMSEERFRRLREIINRFADNGIEAVHENCMNYGGMGWPMTMELVAGVPGLKLLFDTGNPVFTPDYTEPAPRPMQNALDFYRRVREHENRA